MVFFQFYQGLWYNLFFLRSFDRSEVVHPAEFLASQRPFFSLGVPPVATAFGAKLSKAYEGKDLIKLQRSGLKLLCLICVLHAALSQLDVSADATPAFSVIVGPLWSNGRNGFLHHSPSAFGLGMRWLLTYGIYVHWLMIVTIRLGLPVAVCRLLGIDLLAPVYGLPKARTLFQMFERTNHYYCQILTDLFISPIYLSISKIKSVQLRYAISYISGIFLGGVIFHYLLLFYAFRINSGSRLELFSSGCIYWATMAILTWISIYSHQYRRPNSPLENQNSKKINQDRFRNLFKSFIAFSISAMTFVLIMEYEFNLSPLTIPVRISFLLSLFGF